MPKIQELAAQMVKAMHKQTRNDGQEFWSIKDGSPEWMTDVCHAAHGDMMPDDFRYEAIRDALLSLQDADAEETPDSLRDCVYEWADNDTDVYNSDRARWLASNLARADYVDQAIEECGWPKDGGIFEALGYGQNFERREVYEQLISALEEIAGDDEGEAES